jgi:hypothetical protein
MARDLATMGQQIELLKASIEQLKAGQAQISRTVAKASEQNLRPRVATLPPRPLSDRRLDHRAATQYLGRTFTGRIVPALHGAPKSHLSIDSVSRSQSSTRRRRKPPPRRHRLDAPV